MVLVISIILTELVQSIGQMALTVKLSASGGTIRMGLTSPPMLNCSASCSGTVWVMKNSIPELSITPTDGTMF